MTAPDQEQGELMADATDAADPAPSALPDAGTDDWTRGPAKWFAVIVLAGATIGLALWTGFWRVPNPTLVHSGEASGAMHIDGRLDLNTADAPALAQLPGVGPELAERIVADRAERGPFGSVDELDRVPGVGPKTVERVKPMCRVEGESERRQAVGGGR